MTTATAVSVDALTQLSGEMEVFNDLSPQTQQIVAQSTRRKTYAAGDIILEEGSTGRELFIVERGTVVPFRMTGDNAVEIPLAELGTGAIIGEFAFLDDAPRIATVRAQSDTTVLTLSHTDLVAHSDGQAALTELSGALAIGVVRRTRRVNDQLVEGFEEQLRVKALQNQFGHFLVYTIAVFLVSTMMFYIVAEDIIEDVYNPAFVWQGVLLLLIPSLLVIRLLRIPMDQLGIKREGLWRSLGEATVLLAVIGAGVAVYKLMPSGSGADPQGAVIDKWFFLQYIFHCIFQELGSRGLIQGLFQRFLDDKKGHRSVALTSIIFATLHLAFGLHAVIITFFSSIAFGYFYLRSNNLAGVTWLHYGLGCYASILVVL